MIKLDQSKIEKLPEAGTLCEIEVLTKVTAFYTPDNKIAQWITRDSNDFKQPVLLTCSPIEGAETYEEYQERCKTEESASAQSASSNATSTTSEESATSAKK